MNIILFVVYCIVCFFVSRVLVSIGMVLGRRVGYGDILRGIKMFNEYKSKEFLKMQYVNDVGSEERIRINGYVDSMNELLSYLEKKYGKN